MKHIQVGDSAEYSQGLRYNNLYIKRVPEIELLEESHLKGLPSLTKLSTLPNCLCEGPHGKYFISLPRTGIGWMGLRVEALLSATANYFSVNSSSKHFYKLPTRL